MNFSYGIIAAVGVLIAVSLGFIALSPDEVIEPRKVVEPLTCTAEMGPVCGLDGQTYDNMCAMDDAGVRLDYEGQCGPAFHVVTIPTGTSIPGCEIEDICYLPSAVAISAGDAVVWENEDNAAHTVTYGDPQTFPTPIFDSGLLPPGASYEFVFTDSGTYDYFCIVHPWMVGQVTVE